MHYHHKWLISINQLIPSLTQELLCQWIQHCQLLVHLVISYCHLLEDLSLCNDYIYIYTSTAFLLERTLSSNRQHLSYDACLEVRGEIIRTVLWTLYCVLKLCIVKGTLRWAVLTVLWIEFCHTGPISLCVDLFVFICVYFVCFCFIPHSCCIIVTRWCGPDGIEA